MSKRARQQKHIRALRADLEKRRIAQIAWHHMVIEHLEACLARIPCADSGDPATRTTTDGVPLCEHGDLGKDA